MPSLPAVVKRSCGALRAADVGAEVELNGWIHRRRDHGGLIFLDLRDRDGLTQLVVDPAVVAYIAMRIERSLNAARAIVAALDREALSRGKRVTRAMAAEILRDPTQM